VGMISTVCSGICSLLSTGSAVAVTWSVVSSALLCPGLLSVRSGTSVQIFY